MSDTDGMATRTSKASGRTLLIFVGLTLLSSCGAGIGTIALGPPGEGSVDTWDSGLRVAELGLLVPIAFLVGDVLRRAGWWRHGRIVLPAAASLVPIGFAVWSVYYDAPTGRSHAERLAEGRGRLVDDIQSGMNAAGRGPVSFDEMSASECVNDFDRGRGAYAVRLHAYVKPSLSAKEFDRFVGHLRSRSWSISVDRRRESVLGGDGRMHAFDSQSFRAENRGYSISLDDLHSADGLTAGTVCLRRR